MLSVFVCEDDPNQKKRITDCIENYILMEDLDIKVVVSTGLPQDTLDYLQNNTVAGLYFLDVDLNSDIDGIALADKIRHYDPRGFIVFITMHANMLPLTFRYKVEALDFITKDDMYLGSRICECIRNAYEKYTAKTSPLQSNFVFKSVGKRVVSIDSTKILYFEASPSTAHKIVVYSEDSVYDFYGKLDEVQKTLDENFFRCHRSFIVNLKKYIRFDSEQKVLILEQEVSCPVSSRQVGKIKKLLLV